MKLINSFLQRFSMEYDYYYELARQVASICETLLHRNGIRAIVTYRAKKPDSLRDKLNKRNEIKAYTNVEQIYKDIVDLAGVRIATYFPGDREEIGKIVENEFITKKVKLFPNDDQKKNFNFDYKKRFAGYDAIHYRVNIKEDKLNDNLKRFSTAQVEIQIASTLMHAWAEVEHDMAYKPKIGNMSEEEFRILDELNGLVLSGEIALERLQKAFKQRISLIDYELSNHYELAALIREKVTHPNLTIFSMGRVDILLRFLQKLGMDSPKKIYPYFKKIVSYDSQKTIVSKIIDLILYDYPEYYEQYIQSKLEIRTHNPYSPIEKESFTYSNYNSLKQYIVKWIKIEKAIAYLNKKNNSLCNFMIIDSPEVRIKTVFNSMQTRENIQHDIKYLCTLRNQVLYGNELPEEDVLQSASKTLEKMLEKMINEDKELNNVL